MSSLSHRLLVIAALGLGFVTPVVARAAGPQFSVDVEPILTKKGCNSGGCHGKAEGRNGFKLSLFGYEPGFDYQMLARDAGGRRLSRSQPGESLLLLKASGALPHGGGVLLPTSSAEYRTIVDWIASGAAGPSADELQVRRLVLNPPRAVLKPGARQALKVTAVMADGSQRDVTGLAIYQSNEPDVVSVSGDGVVTVASQSGLATVGVRFLNQIAAFDVAIPFAGSPARSTQVGLELDTLERRLAPSFVDRRLLAQWRRLNVAPSAPADDAAFLRRAMIDVCGTLPSPEEVQSFLVECRQERQANPRSLSLKAHSRLIDRLLERSEYASYFAVKWAAILQNRGAGYSTSRQRPGTTLFSNWIRDSLAANKPYDRFVTEILTASGSQNENPPAVWYRSVRKPSEYVESVAQAFLGVRFQCAQCHHHPAERWSQADYFGLAAAFARVGRKGGFADAEVPTDEVIYLKDGGTVTHPRTGEVIPAKAPGGPMLAADSYRDPRRSLAEWLTRPENPFFARTMVNRLWAHFLGRGIIHPIDDARSTNPPSNPELLDDLARDFARSGYDVKHLIRVITNSYAYQLAAAPTELNDGDTQSYARFYPRRIPSEVLLDGFSRVLDVPTEFAGLPLGTRAIDLPDENVPASFLDIFGRPQRLTACECERTDAPALNQALELVSSPEIQRKLAADKGYARRLATDPRPHGERVAEAILRVYGRPPRPDELKTATDFVSEEPDVAEAYRSLLWSLLATNEFLFNH